MGNKRTRGSIQENVACYIKGPDAINKQWTCLFPDCKNQFRRRSRIIYHVQAHLGDRQHQCQHCNKRFIRVHDKNRHENIHSIFKPTRRTWTQAEDKTLIQLLNTQEVRNWVQIAQLIGTRSSKQCHERYHQKLKPSLNHDPISNEEGLQIEYMVASIGNRWSKIARILGGRSENAVKNWWNNRKRHPTTTSPCSPQHALTVNPRSDSINARSTSPTALLRPLNSIEYSTSTQPSILAKSGAFSTHFHNGYSMTPLFKGVEQYSTHRPHFHNPHSILIPSLPPLLSTPEQQRHERDARMNLSFLVV